MHQPHAQPLPSLYFPYAVHPPWVPPHAPLGEAPVYTDRAAVVVVGAGPIGLVTALELARQGVRCVLLESEVQVSEGSRAIVFTRRSLEILQQVGVADRMMAMGLPWRFGNSVYRGQRVYRMEAPHDPDDRFGPLLNVQQQFVEAFLIDAVRAQPLIELRWGNRVTAVEAGQSPGAPADASSARTGQRACLTVDTPAGPYRLEADWVVASDGARSGLRSLLGLRLEGASYEGQFVIADIRIDLPLPTERLAFFDPDWNRGNTVLMHREPHGIWRIDYQLPPGETPDEALRPASLQTRINAQLAMIGHADLPWELDWCSVYSARALTLPDYVHQRVVFVGDAAHLLPIFGVRGANTGFQDAQALAWRLASVVHGLSPVSVLDTYTQERVAAAREIIDEAGKSTRFMTPPTRGFRLLRDAVLSLSLTQPFVGPLYHWRTSRPHEYTHSVLNSRDDDSHQFTAGPGHGAPPANARLDARHFLLDHIGGHLEVLVFTDAAINPAVQARVATWQASGYRVRLVAITPCDGPLQVPGADLTLCDRLGQVRQRYGVSGDGAAYLLRPDQHVCARWRVLDDERLDRALRQAVGTNPLTGMGAES
jgi:3-(3-hydroxy-phenyl)propionate hydroxylase